MSFYLQIQEKFDLYYFNDHINKDQIDLNFPVKSSDLIDYLRASLTQMKCVFIVNDKGMIKNLDINKCKSKHCKIEQNNFIFLNVSLRNHLKKVSNSDTPFVSYHQVEDFFSKEIENLI